MAGFSATAKQHRSILGDRCPVFIAGTVYFENIVFIEPLPAYTRRAEAVNVPNSSLGNALYLFTYNSASTLQLLLHTRTVLYVYLSCTSENKDQQRPTTFAFVIQHHVLLDVASHLHIILFS